MGRRTAPFNRRHLVAATSGGRREWVAIRGGSVPSHVRSLGPTHPGAAAMSVTVRVPTTLRPLTGGASEVSVDGATLGEVLKNLEAVHPGFEERLLDDQGGLRRFVNVFVADVDVRVPLGMDVPDVLVVDDDPDIRAMLGYSLGGESNVRFAAGGREAIEQLAAQPPAAMVLDVMMPDVDGYDVLAARRERGLAPDTHVL